MSTPTTRSAPQDLGLLVTRIALGGVMIAHGIQKAFLQGFAGTQQGFGSMGAPLPGLTAVLVTLLELVGGVAIVLGLATRVVALLYALTMVGAAVLVHLPNGFYAADGGWELVGLLAIVSVALVVAGPGRLSLDHLVAQRRRARGTRSAHAEAGLAAA
jgi:putative oxidoreductase